MIYCPNAWHRFALFCQDNFPRKATTTYVSVYAVSTFSLSLAGFQGGHTGNPSSSHRVGVCMCVCVYLYVNWSRLFIAIILHKFIEAQPNLICLYHIAYNQVFAVTCPQTTSNTLPSLFGSGLGSWNIFCHGSWEQRENIVHRNFFSGTVPIPHVPPSPNYPNFSGVSYPSHMWLDIIVMLVVSRDEFSTEFFFCFHDQTLFWLTHPPTHIHTLALLLIVARWKGNIRGRALNDSEDKICIANPEAWQHVSQGNFAIYL